MRAVVLTGTGGPEVLQVQERPDPPVGPGEVRIAVRAAGINFADTLARSASTRTPRRPPACSATRSRARSRPWGRGSSDCSVGDRVIAGTRFGGQAELVTVPAEQALPLPERLSFEQGAAFPVNYGTAYAALILMGGLRKGDRVLIHAAGGGVGIAATQIARNVGAEIFGTASPGKHEAIRAQGVDHAIDYRSHDFEAEVMRITDGEGVDLVIDALGPTSLPQGLPAAALRRPPGHVRALRDADGGVRSLPATLRAWRGCRWRRCPGGRASSMMNENKGVFGLNMLSWWDREGNLDRVTEPLMADLEAGRLEPVVAEAFPFDRAGEAHEFIAQRRNVGKVVLFP